MKFKINLELFKKYLKKIASLNFSNFSLPESTGVFIEAFENKIVLECKNEYVNYKVELHKMDEFEIIELGSAFIKAKTINDVVSRLESNKIEFTKIEDNLAIIKDEKTEYELNLLVTEKFEKINYSIKETNTIETSGEKIKELFEKVGYSISEKQPRKILQGINFKIENMKLILTATDGIRVAIMKENIETGVSFSKTINIRIVKELLKLLEFGKLKISFDETNALILQDDISIKFSLIEGTFPEVQNAFPKEYQNTLKIEKRELNKLIDNAIALSISRSSESSSLKMSINGKKITFENRELEIGYAMSSSEEFVWSGSSIFSILFNPTFIKDMLKHIPSEKIMIKFNESDKPFLLQEENNEDFVNLILPLRM